MATADLGIAEVLAAASTLHQAKPDAPFNAVINLGQHLIPVLGNASGPSAVLAPALAGKQRMTTRAKLPAAEHSE